MLLDRVFNILSQAADTNDLIDKVRYAPDKQALVVDIRYNKALRVCTKNNEVHVQGDLSAAEKLKEIIEGAIQNGN